MKRKCMLVSTLVLFPILFFALSMITFHLEIMFKFSRRPNPPPTLLNTTTNPKLRILVGILTRADRYDRRHFLRLIYGVQSRHPTARIDVKFVTCRLTKPEQRAFVGLEMIRFDDMIVLENCTENMNDGKTYTYFSSLPRLFARDEYDYVMKADDDVFLRLGQLASALEPLPRLDLYYGFVLPCASRNPFSGYMSGMGFVLSWDIVEWIAESDIPRKDLFGPEDRTVGKWLRAGGKAKNRFTEKPGMYDYPGTNGKCSHDLVPGTVAVHRLKRWDQWLRVVQYFNLTQGLNFSATSL